MFTSSCSASPLTPLWEAEYVTSMVDPVSWMTAGAAKTLLAFEPTATAAPAPPLTIERRLIFVLVMIESSSCAGTGTRGGFDHDEYEDQSSFNRQGRRRRRGRRRFESQQRLRRSRRHPGDRFDHRSHVLGLPEWRQWRSRTGTREHVQRVPAGRESQLPVPGHL